MSATTLERPTTRPRSGLRAIADERRAAIIDEAEFLIGTDHVDSIARRLGYTCSSNLARALYRWGRPDLAGRYETRDRP